MEKCLTHCSFFIFFILIEVLFKLHLKFWSFKLWFILHEFFSLSLPFALIIRLLFTTFFIIVFSTKCVHWLFICLYFCSFWWWRCTKYRIYFSANMINIGFLNHLRSSVIKCHISFIDLIDCGIEVTSLFDTIQVTLFLKVLLCVCHLCHFSNIHIAKLYHRLIEGLINNIVILFVRDMLGLFADYLLLISYCLH